MQQTSAHILGTIFLTAPLLLAGCGTPPGSADQTPGSGVDPLSGQPRDASAPRAPVDNTPAPWTDLCADKAMVLADEIRITGPAGLLDHLVLRSDDGLFEREVVTTEEGLSISVKPRVPGELVRGQLDNWALSAIRTIVMLESPFAEALEVTAVGEALWQDVNGQEQRADRLVWRGELE